MTTASSVEEEAELYRLASTEKDMWIDKYELLLADHQGLTESYNRILKELERESDEMNSIEVKQDANDSFFIEQELLRGYSSRKNAEERLRLVDIRLRGDDKECQVDLFEFGAPTAAELIRQKDEQIVRLESSVADIRQENDSLREKLVESQAKTELLEQELARCRICS